MHYRPPGSTDWHVSAISFGAWAIGGSWADVDDTMDVVRGVHDRHIREQVYHRW